MSNVTVPGNGGAQITLSTTSDASTYLAQAIGSALANASNPVSVTAASGAIPALPTTPNTTEVLNLTGSAIHAVIPNASFSDIYDTSSNSATISGANLELVAAAGGGLFNVSGNSTVAAVGGANTITAIGNYTIGTGDGNNVVFASGVGWLQTGTGNNIVVVNGTGSGAYVDSLGADLIVANSGAVAITAAGRYSGILGGGSGSITTNIVADDVTVSSAGTNLAATVYGSSALIFGGSGTSQINLGVNAAGATIAGGTGNETIDASQGTFGDGPVLFDSTGTVNFLGGAGGATIVGGTAGGHTHATVGAGALLFATGTNNAATITSGSFSNIGTFFGGSGSDVVFNSTGSGTTGSAIFAAGAGNETLNATASGTNNVFYAGSFYAGSGGETLSGGTGSNQFNFLASNTSGGQDRITDFNATDSVNLFGYNAPYSITGGNGSAAIVTLSDNTTITFSNVTTGTSSLIASIHSLA